MKYVCDINQITGLLSVQEFCGWLAEIFLERSFPPVDLGQYSSGLVMACIARRQWDNLEVQFNIFPCAFPIESLVYNVVCAILCLA